MSIYNTYHVTIDNHNGRHVAVIVARDEATAERVALATDNGQHSRVIRIARVIEAHQVARV